MSSSLINFTEFKVELDQAILTTVDVTGKYPDDPAIAAILGKIRQLKHWTERGQTATPAQKDTLNFGALARRNLDDIDDASHRSLKPRLTSPSCDTRRPSFPAAVRFCSAR